jgi:hypothetical protein
MSKGSTLLVGYEGPSWFEFRGHNRAALEAVVKVLSIPQYREILTNEYGR